MEISGKSQDRQCQRAWSSSSASLVGETAALTAPSQSLGEGMGLRLQLSGLSRTDVLQPSRTDALPASSRGFLRMLPFDPLPRRCFISLAATMCFLVTGWNLGYFSVKSIFHPLSVLVISLWILPRCGHGFHDMPNRRGHGRACSLARMWEPPGWASVIPSPPPAKSRWFALGPVSPVWASCAALREPDHPVSEVSSSPDSGVQQFCLKYSVSGNESVPSGDWRGRECLRPAASNHRVSMEGFSQLH